MPLRQLHAVIRTRGPAWQDARPIEGQADWASHASFMDALVEEGFVILGGPLEGSPDVLLVVRAGSAGEIHSSLEEGSWTGNDLLRTTRINVWTLRLGSLEG